MSLKTKVKTMGETSKEDLLYLLGIKMDEVGILKDKLHIANDTITILDHHVDNLKATILQLALQKDELEATIDVLSNNPSKKFTSIDEAYENEWTTL